MENTTSALPVTGKHSSLVDGNMCELKGMKHAPMFTEKLLKRVTSLVQGTFSILAAHGNSSGGTPGGNMLDCCLCDVNPVYNLVKPAVQLIHVAGLPVACRLKENFPKSGPME